MHPRHTLSNRWPKYPALKRSPCDLNKMNYGFPRKISDTLHSGVTYRIIADYKKTNGRFVNYILVLRNITNDKTVAVYSFHMLKKLYGGEIENLTPVLLKALSKVHICYVGKIENGSYNFIIKM